MTPRGHQEKLARNFLIYEARIRSCKTNRYASNYLDYCGIPSMGEEHILAPYFGDRSAKNLNFKESF